MGRLENSKIPERLGFSRLMINRLKKGMLERIVKEKTSIHKPLRQTPTGGDKPGLHMRNRHQHNIEI